MRTMKFTVEVVSRTSSRLGCLSRVESGKSFQTPLLVHSTKSGSIPYLSRETFGYVTDHPQILQICLASCDHMERALEVYKKGIGSFVGYGDYPTCLALKDPCEIAPSGYHEKDVVPVFTRRGKTAITVDRYMNFVERSKPDIYHALCDSDTNEESPKKRIIKSLERTEIFFRECWERQQNSEILKNSLFLAPIVGGYSKEGRSKLIKTIPADAGIGGYFIDGLHNNGETALKVNINSVKEIVSHCLKELNDDKLRMMTGAYTPLMILELVQLGIDVFDTSLVYVFAINFRALTFNFDVEKKSHDIPFFVDFSQEKHKEAFEPILKGCECLACRKHTKAYIYHLYNTNELLGPILLMMHNIHHYMRFFETVRKAISADTLLELTTTIREQTEAIGETLYIVPKKTTSESPNNRKEEKEPPIVNR